MRSSSPVETEYSIDYTTITVKATRTPLNFLYPIMPSSSSSPTMKTTFLPHCSSSSSSTTTHNPHSHSLNHAHHSPGGKRHSRRKEREQQEIARLLDPSYQGGETHHPQGRRSLEAYVDKDGDLHDPDFRYFPSAEAFVSRTRRDDGVTRRRTTSPRRGDTIKPYWTHESENALADEEEEEELLAQELGSTDFLAMAGYGNGTSSDCITRSRTARSRRDGSFSSYARGYPGYSSGYTSYTPPFSPQSATTTTSNTSYYSPTMTTTTLPTSYESETTVLSSSAELDGEKEAGVKGLLAAAKRRRRLSKGEKEKKDDAKESRRSFDATRSSVLEPTREDCEHRQQSHPTPSTPEKVPIHDTDADAVDIEARGDDDAEDIEFIQSHSEYVPTCSEALKRHWLSFSLRFRFGVYRAQRRFVHRVHSMF